MDSYDTNDSSIDDSSIDESYSNGISDNYDPNDYE